MFGPTHKAVLEGRVQGVVVHAIKYGVPHSVHSFFGSATLNNAVTTVSFTSL